MRFRVGPHVYRLRIADGAIELDGRRCMGLCDEDLRLILLSPDCPPRRRLGMLIHELVHAWIFHTGEPKELEGWCDLVGTVVAGTIRDLAACGGEPALARLSAGESPHAATCRVSLTRERYCGKCSAAVAGGSVVCEPAEIWGVLRMALFCEHCNHVQTWQEIATAVGLPSGTVIGEALYETKAAAVERFLADHPHAWAAFV